jgi:hypothetical protein
MQIDEWLEALDKRFPEVKPTLVKKKGKKAEKPKYVDTPLSITLCDELLQCPPKPIGKTQNAIAGHDEL